MFDEETQKHYGLDITRRLVNWAPGHRVGPYRIREKLGEGGMGVVYLAEQMEPIRRMVALKVVKLGLDIAQVVGRFESERQALAMMDHPGIAEIFEAGATQEGLPYFVMEYVPGATITAHCDENRLNLRDRLELFLQVCEAVQHAHHKAIIHRDLKPSNILVNVQDRRTSPKIIDFGLAKTLAQPLTDKTVYTGIGQLLGTPRYMSPEQADLTRHNVDTRTDIYSLGGVLYELLVGMPPVDLSGAGFVETMRIIREQDPAPPSRRLRTLDPAEAARIAKARSEDPAGLARRLRGDLDWIVMKALDKDRNRRYCSPTELATDLRHFLADRPVLARPPNMMYRARKYARRHRLAVTSLAGVLAVTVLFAFVSVAQARRIVAERDRANQEATTARQVAEFLTGLFKMSDPYVAQGHQPSARELLDRGATQIRTRLAGQPLVQARLEKTMAEAYENLGLYEQAESLYQNALERLKGLLGQDHPETLETSGDFFGLRWRQGRIEEAQEGLLQTLEQKRRVLGEAHPSTLRAVNNLANVYMIRGRYEEARNLYELALETRRRVQGADHPDTLGAANNLANLYDRIGREKEAGQLYLETLHARERVQGRAHPDTIGAASNLAEYHSSRKRFEEAERIHLDVLERRKKILGDRHPDTLTTLSNIGDLHRRRGNLQLADKYLTTALQGRTEVLGENHHDTVTTLFNLGSLRRAQGKYDEARRLLTQAASRWTALFGSSHPYVLQAKDGLARLEYRRKQYGAAETLFAEILEEQKKRPELQSEVTDTLFNLACVKALQSDRRPALEYLKEAVDRGLSDPAVLADPDLRSLRTEADFRALATRLGASPRP